MAAAKNILFIMCDQLRFDYLSCAGHKHLFTPNIDALAARGVRFSRAYVQSPVCGPSRMSFYTGRYMRSHGANWNRFPLRVDEPTMGDALAAIGVRNVLVGKTHMQADAEGMRRLGIQADSPIGVHVSECGFEPYERDDGLHPDAAPRPRYDSYLREQGFDADNPREQWANSGEDADGNLLNGWLLGNADKEARLPEHLTETPYMTRRAMAFIDEAMADARPWCLHLSYIKPHWPYIAPSPYHLLYGVEEVLPAVRSEAERQHPHPMFGAFMDSRASRAFARDEVRERVIPAYMGLIKQIDDSIGRLMGFLDERGLLDSTMVVFTSDHGDYLGDHWMGEKDLFHECSVKVPLIIADPSSSADATRGTVCDALVEAIDLAPTFVAWFGGVPPSHIMEGRSLLPWLRGELPAWRDCVFSEYDYSMQSARLALGQKIADCRLFMVFDGRWKYVHATGFRPMLYDLATDPQEFRDLGDDPEFAEVRARMKDRLFDWALRDHARVTMPDDRIAAYRGGEGAVRQGVLIGFWDEAELRRVKEAQ
jgi:arylsulfatase A-like enzyme